MSAYERFMLITGDILYVQTGLWSEGYILVTNIRL